MIWGTPSPLCFKTIVFLNQTDENQEQCSCCQEIIEENKELKKEVKVLKSKVTKLSNKMDNNQQQWVKTLEELQKQSDNNDLRPDCGESSGPEDHLHEA